MTDLIEADMEKDGDDLSRKECLTGELLECIGELTELAEKGGFVGNLWHCYLADLLVNDENAYSLACEMQKEPEGSIRQIAAHDFAVLRTFFDYDLKALAERLDVPELEITLDYVRDDRAGGRYNRRISGHICQLAKDLAKTRDALEMKGVTAAFYEKFGVGKFGLSSVGYCGYGTKISCRKSRCRCCNIGSNRTKTNKWEQVKW